MEFLRCKTPELVRKEVWAHVLAYNLIRTIIAQAATNDTRSLENHEPRSNNKWQNGLRKSRCHSSMHPTQVATENNSVTIGLNGARWHVTFRRSDYWPKKVHLAIRPRPEVATRQEKHFVNP